MPSTIPILRERRKRRIAKQHKSEARTRNTLLSAGMILSLLIAALIIVAAFSYVNLTRDLPSVGILPSLLNPPDGLLLQPTRITDRTGENVIYTFAPTSGATLPRRYIPLGDNNPQYLPRSLADAVIARSDQRFWRHAGYDLSTITNYESHTTLAQRLVFELILFNEPSGLRRALRERILAAQITAEFGRTQILEWYLNSAHFGRHAFGAEAAAQLYFGKSAAQLTTAESAILPPGELLRIFRLKRAAQLLSKKAGNISQIAYDTGFNSLSHFTKCFKEQFGSSPSEYMQDLND
jgi:membrane carboxypeptidase/penicillin-binding protein